MGEKNHEIQSENTSTSDIPLLSALRIRLPTPYYDQLVRLRIKIFIQYTALGHIVWVRPKNNARRLLNDF